MADSARALECAPCLVLFRNIHMVGRDAKKDEPRLAAAFLSLMSYISQHNKKSAVDFPIMVVATAPKQAAIPAQVAMEMLHVVEMATPTETQRLVMLRGLARDYLTSPSVPWTQLARLTAGFVLGDVVSLLSRASNFATTAAFDQLSVFPLPLSSLFLHHPLCRCLCESSLYLSSPACSGPRAELEMAGGWQYPSLISWWPSASSMQLTPMPSELQKSQMFAGRMLGGWLRQNKRSWMPSSCLWRTLTSSARVCGGQEFFSMGPRGQGKPCSLRLLPPNVAFIS
ncbi:Peroxisome assembly factor 2 [Geodia barretti]|uniref:Peroxisome assembly factor 2 n=1 Tax=Geodia barretti TaxID=519541 RepID=A0AA35R557_GEOBA|nr:Peroxisome assembly factor 2 [Geodia barretti]